ncbi:MAG: hypothetical protein GSR74_02240 [Desulfurococcales archaeon]|nr:hypothetical protein [Desulfurococcales archaeon]
MYTGAGNISREVVVEHLVNISRELESLIVAVNSLIGEENLPSTEYLDKFLRQDVFTSKERIESNIAQLLLYIASGRIELVDSKELILRITEELRSITSKLEALVHRVKIASKAGVKVPPSILGEIKSMLSLVTEASGHVTTLVRLMGRAYGNHSVARMMETRNDKVQEIERLVDDSYRRILDSLVTEAKDFKEYVLLRDTVDLIEDITDNLSRLSLNLYVMGVSLASTTGATYEESQFEM